MTTRTHETKFTNGRRLHVKRLSDGTTFNVEVDLPGGVDQPFLQAYKDDRVLHARLQEDERYRDTPRGSASANQVSGFAHASKTAALQAVKDFFAAAEADERSAAPVSFPPPDDG